MSRDNYKRLGEYIEPVNIRNKDLEVTRLLGVSIQKVLMPSIANTVGTDMSKYKIIYKKQFAYGPVTSRNGNKISVALLDEYDTAIVSQAYTVFEITDHTELDPEYLMMWFRRPEFDRYARFKSHGSAREIFDWDEMCDTELPIPSIQKQHEIVVEYNTIVNRIKLNEQLNQKLEETAQAIYKHWFVDFEFPDEKGKPYKSSGGEMVWCEELGKDVPVGWFVDELQKRINIKHGYAFKGDQITEIECENILLTPGNFKIGGGFKGTKYRYYNGDVPKEYVFNTGDVMVTMTDLSKAGDTLGYPAIIPKEIGKEFLHNQRLGKIEFKEDYKISMFYYWLMRTSHYRFNILGSATGTTVKHTSPSRILNYKFSFPKNELIISYFQKTVLKLNTFQEKIMYENQLLLFLSDLVQSKMSNWNYTTMSLAIKMKPLKAN